MNPIAYVGLPYTLQINHRTKVAIYKKGNRPNGDLDRILRAVSEVTKITVDQIKSKDRTLNTKIARFYYCYFAKEMDSDTLVQIGKQIGRHHATVIHAHSKICDWMTYDKHVNRDIELIKEMI